ncbi:MAG: inositol monophosphatase/fructose,6-bisphosphatase family protein [Actinomycetia bacterium]|nr:inositol monophosphatase/fructose,6-bisphosphatase family protein [Actinomycetes bacterium]
MSGLDLPVLLEAALEAARIGGGVVERSWGGAEFVRAKAPGDWVSEVDVESEHAIRNALARAAPGIAFFGEESGGERADVGWFVDPLDGTSNFLHGLHAVGVSIGLVADGRPVVGVVHAPMLGETFTATEGGGAFRNGVELHVSERLPEAAICGTGFPFRRRHMLDAYVETFLPIARSIEDIRRIGSATLDLAWTAAGVLDGFFELGLGTWDVAAGALLVREAGGIVTDWAGDPDAWLVSGDTIAGPPAVHAHLLAAARAGADARRDAAIPAP